MVVLGLVGAWSAGKIKYRFLNKPPENLLTFYGDGSMGREGPDKKSQKIPCPQFKI